MRTISAREAVRNKRNVGDFAQWSQVVPETAALGYEDVVGDMAGARVHRSFTPRIRPKFTLGSDPAIFTSGSCFAREIELALGRAGKSVLSWSEASGLSNVIFNRYNTFSIVNDFRFAHEGSYDPRLASETPKGWIDYSASGVYPTREEMLDQRARCIAAHRNVAQADVFICTLGLIEAWYDLETQTYLNFTPSEILAGNLGRFECRITDYEENLAALRNLVAYLRAHFRKDLKVIVTVSPVPLNVTFSGIDIAQANMLSKATLRTVAQAFVDEDPLADYFPSYEMVTLTDFSEAWLPDFRHVRYEMVDRIMRTFIENYLV